MMKKNIIPDWLKTILDDSGLEQGKYSFSEEHLDLPGLSDDYVGIAEADDGGLAVSKAADGVVYRLENGKMDVYAIDNQEFMVAVRRDEAWEVLAENMPAIRTFGLGIILKTKDRDGRELALGMKGSSRNSAMVIQGEMRSGEMLTDALNRILSESFEITNYDVADVFDEGGELKLGEEVSPIFSVTVTVDQFDTTMMGDSRIGWIEMDDVRVVN